jgi:hypothetical protein
VRAAQVRVSRLHASLRHSTSFMHASPSALRAAQRALAQ